MEEISTLIMHSDSETEYIQIKMGIVDNWDIIILLVRILLKIYEPYQIWRNSIWKVYPLTDLNMVIGSPVVTSHLLHF